MFSYPHELSRAGRYAARTTQNYFFDARHLRFTARFAGLEHALEDMRRKHAVEHPVTGVDYSGLSELV